VDLWILGSSLFGAQLAAMLGLPYAFASTSRPITSTPRSSSIASGSSPSATLDKPHAMAAINVLCAPSDEEAQFLASSQDQSFVRLRSGDPGACRRQSPHYRDTLAAPQRATLDHFRQVSAIGSPPPSAPAGSLPASHRRGRADRGRRHVRSGLAPPLARAHDGCMGGRAGPRCGAGDRSARSDPSCLIHWCLSAHPCQTRFRQYSFHYQRVAVCNSGFIRYQPTKDNETAGRQADPPGNAGSERHGDHD
jgi:hypothetical protein